MKVPLSCTSGSRFLWFKLGLIIVSCLVLGQSASAQWASESYALTPGWNAIWLPLDASDRTLDTIFPNTVEQVWQWNPAASSAGFTASPSQPTPADVQWHVWQNGAASNTLSLLTGNAAYLVKVADAAAPFTLSVLGKPVPPALPWKTSGVNLVGFPTAAGSPPDFFSFFKSSAALKSGPQVFRYVGGPLSDTTPKNPQLVSQAGSTPVTRNQAYWVQSTTFTDFYGPLGITMSQPQGVDFGDKLITTSIRIKNVTDPAQSQSVSATLTPSASSTPPNGQPAVAGSVPLLIRGAFDPVTSTYAYTSLTGPLQTASIAPGQFVDVILAVDRSSMSATAGSIYQSLLTVTDSLGRTSIPLPVRAVSTSLEGLWVGVAVVDNVSQIVGQTATPGAAPSNFPVRLILHRTDAGVTTLLQEVYLGVDTNGVGFAFSKLGLDHQSAIKAGTRLSSASFRRDLVASGTGQLGISGAVSFSDTIGATDPTNPFYHKYHPDHDNLDAKFQPITAGSPESYAVKREITLTFVPPDAAHFDPTAGSTTVSGTYGETVTGLRGQPITVSGSFILHLVATPATLVTQ